MTNTMPPPSSINVLVVENERSQWLCYEDVLATLPCTFRICGSGSEALEALEDPLMTLSSSTSVCPNAPLRRALAK